MLSTHKCMTDKLPHIFRFLVWSAFFFPFFRNTRRKCRARVGALAWDSARVRARVGLGRRPLAISWGKKYQNTKTSPKKLYIVKCIWCFICTISGSKTGTGASFRSPTTTPSGGSIAHEKLESCVWTAVCHMRNMLEL